MSKELVVLAYIQTSSLIRWDDHQFKASLGNTSETQWQKDKRKRYLPECGGLRYSGSLAFVSKVI